MWTRAIEKLGSRQTALKERKAAERTSGRPAAVKTPITSTPIALRATPAPAEVVGHSSPAWTNAIEKLGSRQTALQERRDSGTDFGPAVRGQDTTQQQTDRAQSDAGGSQAVGQQLPGLDEGGREAPQQQNCLLERAATTDVAGTLNRMRDALRRDASMGARLALPPQDL